MKSYDPDIFNFKPHNSVVDCSTSLKFDMQVYYESMELAQGLRHIYREIYVSVSNYLQTFMTL